VDLLSCGLTPEELADLEVRYAAAKLAAAQAS
jgi:hypothetical protein